MPVTSAFTLTCRRLSSPAFSRVSFTPNPEMGEPPRFPPEAFVAKLMSKREMPYSASPTSPEKSNVAVSPATTSLRLNSQLMTHLQAAALRFRR